MDFSPLLVDRLADLGGTGLLALVVYLELRALRGTIRELQRDHVALFRRVKVIHVQAEEEADAQSPR